jgi:hypothetical protein
VAASADTAARRAPSRTLPWAVAGVSALAAAAVYTYVRNPYLPGAFPACMFHAGTRLYCPGCGGLRAAHELLHGDVAAAMSMNPLVVMFVVPLFAVTAVWALGAASGLPWRAPRIHPAVAWGVVALILVFTVMRNLPPFAPYLAP